MPFPGEQQRPPTDAELIAMVRAGDRRAYGPLYERHRSAALRVARYLARDEASAEDLAAEAFTRVLAAIDRGNGPDEAFRAYLYTTLRRTAFDWAESDKRVRLVENIAELEVTAAPVTGADRDPLEEAFDRQITSRAFHSLPERRQIVLWHLEVEGETPADVAPLLDLTPSAVSALAYRAREELRQAFLREHLAETVSEGCRPFARRLAAFVRGKLRRRDAAKVERHLDTCVECTGLYLELLRFHEALPEVLSPLVFGSAAAAKIIAGVALGATGATGVVTTGAVATSAATTARKQRTRAITMAAAVVVACALLAWGMSGNGEGVPPLDMPSSSPSSAVALPAPSDVTAGWPTPRPPAPRTPPRPVVPPPPRRRTPIASPPAPRPTPPRPTQAPPKPSPTPTAPAPPPPTTPMPSPTATPSPSPTPTTSAEPTICPLAWLALHDPTPENIGLVLAARWDPLCVPVPWVTWPWPQWPDRQQCPRNDQQNDQQSGWPHFPRRDPQDRISDARTLGAAG